jgi:hypothetical protein
MGPEGRQDAQVRHRRRIIAGAMDDAQWSLWKRWRLFAPRDRIGHANSRRSTDVPTRNHLPEVSSTWPIFGRGAEGSIRSEHDAHSDSRGYNRRLPATAGLRRFLRSDVREFDLGAAPACLCAQFSAFGPNDFRSLSHRGRIGLWKDLWLVRRGQTPWNARIPVGLGAHVSPAGSRSLLRAENLHSVIPVGNGDQG